MLESALRGVAQPGSAPAWGAGGREFKSLRPDQFSRPFSKGPSPKRTRAFFVCSEGRPMAGASQCCAAGTRPALEGRSTCCIAAQVDPLWLPGWQSFAAWLGRANFRSLNHEPITDDRPSRLAATVCLRRRLWRRLPGLQQYACRSDDDARRLMSRVSGGPVRLLGARLPATGFQTTAAGCPAFRRPAPTHRTP